MKLFCAWVAIWLCPVAATAGEFRVTVEAGASDRSDTPVSLELPLVGVSDETPVCVSADGSRWPGQIETLAGGRARVWWVVDRLPAGQSKNYKIEVGRSCAKEQFHWKNDRDRSMELLFGDRRVLRYVCRPFDPNAIETTKKPFHHVFDPDGSGLITKGPGGLYSHHRGIFFGYNRCMVGGERYDIWHAARGEHQLHRKVFGEITGPVVGGHTVKIHWNDRAGKPFVEETRTLRVFRQSRDRLLIELASELHATRGTVGLDGDRQHAGVQFRAAQEVAERQSETRYLRPPHWNHLQADQEINTPEHRDLPWNALQYRLGERRYTVAYLSDPANPKGADFSERLYGRFGEFFPYELTKPKPLSVRYRWWISAEAAVTPKQIEQRYQDLADSPRVVRKQ